MSRQEMFREYPDVVNIEQLCEMLGGVSVKAAYQRLHSGEIAFFRIGRGCNQVCTRDVYTNKRCLTFK